MEYNTIGPDPSIALFVKNILVFEEIDKQKKIILPFFADGYPGLMFQETENGLLISPHNKKMPPFFLYGQTIKPIEFVLKGTYKLIAFQLFPFVLKSFFGISPKAINDDCYNLEQLQNNEVTDTINKLQLTPDIEKRIALLTAFLYAVFQSKKETLDFKVRQAIQLILDNKGQLSVVKLCAELNINERTFERRFLNEVGVPPKQFSKIIQFQQSLEQLAGKEYSKLTDIVYSNGFADQSLFIKVFKEFTGKTPKRFQNKKI